MKCFVLPEGFATPDIGAVQAFLAANAAAPVRIDASRLRVLDTRLIELLLCAVHAWRARGLAFDLVGLTQRHEAKLRRLAVPADVLAGGGAS